jgi:hypothetical protein
MSVSLCSEICGGENYTCNPQIAQIKLLRGRTAFDSLAAYETYRARLRALENFSLAQSKRIILREERNFVQVVEGTFALPPQQE